MATLGDWWRLRCSRTQGAQVAVNALPSAVVAPTSEVAIHGLPRREVRRQHAPRAAGSQDVQDGLDHSPQVGLARPPQRGIGGKVDGKYRPLHVAQPRGIGWVVASMACPLYLPVGQLMPWKLPDF